MQRVAIIMAGGVGERFWPLSRQGYPKQLLKIGNHRTMLDAAMERIQPLVEPEHIYVITGKSLKAAIERETKGVRAANVIAEPEGKNTAACLALASALIRKNYGDAVTFVLTADHFIHDVQAFQRDCRAAGDFAETRDALVTFGVRPDR